MHPPVHLFHFHAAFGNNNRLAPPLLGLVPPMGNTGVFLKCWKSSLNFTVWTAVADPRGDAPGARPLPHGPKFSQFHAVFRKIWQNHMLAPPPTGNPVSAPVKGNLMPEFWVMTLRFQTIRSAKFHSSVIPSCSFLLHMRRRFDEHTSGN